MEPIELSGPVPVVYSGDEPYSFSDVFSDVAIKEFAIPDEMEQECDTMKDARN